MKHTGFTLAACVFFAAGWWGDGWLARRPAGTEPVNGQIPVTVPAMPAAPVVVSMAEVVSRENRKVPAIRTADDLLRLIIPGREAASRAAIQRALASLKPQDFTMIAGELEVTDNRLAAVALAERWLNVDPVPALEFVFRHSDAILSNVYHPCLAAMEKVFASDLTAATRLLSMPARDRAFYIDARLAWISSMDGQDPAKALAVIADFEMKSGNDRMGAEVLREFPSRWIGEDPQAAMEWALALPPGFTRNNILEKMADAWGAMDAVAAQDYVNALPVATLPKGNLRNGLLGRITRATPARPAEK